jgi:hypothetical protein
VVNRYRLGAQIYKNTKRFANVIAMVGGLALVGSVSATKTMAGFIQ